MTSTPNLTPANINSAPGRINQNSPAAIESVVSPSETVFNLGLWLSGLVSFLKIRTHAFAETNQSKSVARDWSREFRLTSLALQNSSDSALRLSEILRGIESETEFEIGENLDVPADSYNFSFDEIFALSVNLKNLILLNEALLRGAPLSLGEWVSWSEILSDRLLESGITAKIIASAESQGEKKLPPVLLELLRGSNISPALKSDLEIILPYFAKTLKWLEVIEKMLANDEPLKPTLLIFARVYEQTQAMMSYLRNRLLRFASEEDVLYGVFDCTLYAASIELRKVFNFELAGLAEMRQPISIRAKIETSYALLNDCTQLILVQFAQFIDPNFEPTRLFPTFQTKFEQSMTLRQDLWFILQIVQKAEHDPSNLLLEKLTDKLNRFTKTSLRFLMYKDCETFERFAEEVMRTRVKKDLVPILHRFGAYLETLFGQVNMRTVLSTFPFDYPPLKD